MITLIFWVVFVLVVAGFFVGSREDWDGGILGVLLGVLLASAVGLVFFIVVDVSFAVRTSRDARVEKLEGYEEYRVVCTRDSWDPFQGRHTEEDITEFGADGPKAEHYASNINEAHKKRTSKFVEVK